MESERNFPKHSDHQKNRVEELHYESMTLKDNEKAAQKKKLKFLNALKFFWA